MGSHTFTLAAVLFAACCALGCWRVQASDPELTTDFAVPAGFNVSTLDGSFFTNSTLRDVTAKDGSFATVTPVNAGVFPALQGLGVSSALLQFPMGTVNPPHTHPRGTELLYIMTGSLFVGLIDTTNKLYTQTLYEGDLFVFPKGLVHFQVNYQSTTVKAVAAFSSSNPGTVRLPNILFKSNIDDSILATAFGVSSDIIDELKAATVN